MMDIFSIFIREIPGWFLIFGIFLPFALLLILFIAYLSWKLKEVNDELAVAADPRERVYELCIGSASSRPKHKTRLHPHT